MISNVNGFPISACPNVSWLNFALPASSPLVAFCFFSGDDSFSWAFPFVAFSVKLNASVVAALLTVFSASSFAVVSPSVVLLNRALSAGAPDFVIVGSATIAPFLTTGLTLTRYSVVSFT